MSQWSAQRPTLTISKQVRSWADDKFKKAYVGPRCHTGNQQIYYGFIGEALHLHHLPYDVHPVFNKDFDVLIRRDAYSEPLAAEIKTQSMNTTPKPHFRYCIPVEEVDGKPFEVISFAVIQRDLKAAWLIGYLSKTEFLEKSRKVMKGTPMGNVDRLYQATGYEIEFSAIRPYRWILQ